MKAADFDYARARDVGEVCRLLAGADGDGKIIAGGQTLVPLLAMRLARPVLLVDINGVAELQGIATEGDDVVVRACTRQATALADATIRAQVPLLAKALHFVGHVQTRNRGTIGGSLANADPSAEIGIATMALGAVLSARSPEGERKIAVGDFLAGAMTTALSAEECLTQIRYPVWREAGRIGTGFQEVSARRSDFALVAAAAQVLLDERGVCRRGTLAVGGLGGAPVRLSAAIERLVGTSLAESDIAAAAEIAQASIEPESDLHASADYRRRVAGALLARAVTEARGEALAGRA
jgi:CO/xanthine dehydrogenase FAD-binding subunit